MNQTIRKELLAQLPAPCTEAKEISRLYVANLQRDIVQLIEFLNECPPERQRRCVRQNPLLLQMKETLESITVKPEKGRRKDLRKIEQAVRAMRKSDAPWEKKSDQKPEIYILRHGIAVERGTQGYKKDSDRPLTKDKAKTKCFRLPRRCLGWN